MDCHVSFDDAPAGDRPVILIGNPNVGKSVLFAALTGHYVIVSNYPGTTVEVAHGTLTGTDRSVIDTPGVRSIVPLSDDERVSRDIVLEQTGATVVQVLDAKNLRRGLLLTLELAEAGVPLLVVLNMVDEAEARGFSLDEGALARALGVPVVKTVAVKGEGIADVVANLDAARPASARVTYDDIIETGAVKMRPSLPDTAVSPRSLAMMLMASSDHLPEALDLDAEQVLEVRAARAEAEQAEGQPLGYAINRHRLEAADAIVAQAMQRESGGNHTAETLGRLAAHPVWGWPILIAVLFAVYLFVGWFGAGVLVNFLQNTVFGEWINPAVTNLVDAVVPWPVVQDFLVGPFGLVTMALTYSIAIVLPIVGTFFIAFGVLEDSGYLPRLAVMLDRAFAKMGLNGKAVLPMILGLGCDTMATMTTRILETRKERLQVTLLLALGVPCSAQLGVILGMVSATGVTGMLIWSGVIIGVLLVVGWLSSKVIPGQRSDFILELPPMRVPAMRNIVVKTAARMEWYVKEVVPIFIYGTAALFALDAVGALSVIERWMSPLVVGWLGLPPEAAGVLLVGFLRRDYGAAGLFALWQQGMLDPNQVLVSLVVITLFIPCFANLMMIAKEHGQRVAAAVAAFVFPFAIFMGGVVKWFLEVTGIVLK
jgi:ferrous iron transport protein B